MYAKFESFNIRIDRFSFHNVVEKKCTRKQLLNNEDINLPPFTEFKKFWKT